MTSRASKWTAFDVSKEVEFECGTRVVVALTGFGLVVDSPATGELARVVLTTLLVVVMGLLGDLVVWLLLVVELSLSPAALLKRSPMGMVETL